MRRRTAVKFMGAAVASAALPSFAAPAILRRTKPNLLMIVTSQERAWNNLPAAIALPSRQRIAERATNFSNFHSAGTLSSPARAALYTGQHWQKTGMNNNLTPTSKDLAEGTPTLGHMLQAAGYNTAYRGKWHLSRINSRHAQSNRKALRRYGFQTYSDLWDSNGPQDGHLRDVIVATEASAFIDAQRNSNQPWFLAANLFNPRDIMYFHKPGFGQPGILPTAEEPDIPLYKQRHNIRFSPNFGLPDLDKLPANHRRSIEIMSVYFGDIDFANSDAWLQLANYYINCLQESDRNIGIILDSLEASGMADNTVILFVSDHGELLGSHGMRDKGSNFYREVVNPPLLISHPDSRRPIESGALVSGIDIVPTLLELLNVRPEIRETFQPALKGKSISGSVFSGAGSGPRASSGVLFNQGNTMFMDIAQTRKMAALMEKFPELEYHPDKPPMMPPRIFGKLFGPPEPNQALRGLAIGISTGRYKFARYFSPDNPNTPTSVEELRSNNDLELYDLEKDPWEKRNLANSSDSNQLILDLSKKADQLAASEIPT